MRRWWPLLPLLCAAMTCETVPPDVEIKTGMTQEEMDEEPTWHAMKAAILSDVRIWRELNKRLQDGKKLCSGIVWVEGQPTCAKDQELLEIYPLRHDAQDQNYRVEEMAYLCPLEMVYFYRYVGGPRKLDVWLGPYKIVRRRIKPEEEPPR